MRRALSKGKGVLLVMLLLFYIGLHIFVQQHNYNSADTIFHYVTYIVIGVSCVIYYYFLMDIWREEVDLMPRHANLLLICQVFLFCVVVLLQMKFLAHDFWLDSRMIYLWGHELPKKYLFDLLEIIFFPVSVAIVLISMKDTDSLSVRITGVMEILLLTLMGYFLFYGLGYVWLVNMAMLNIVALSAALYQIPALAAEKNGNRIACVILYTLFHIILLAVMKKDGASLYSSLYRGDWDNYQECVKELLANASFWGQNGGLRSMSCVQETLLCGHGNYIHSLLYYFGGSAVLVYMITLVLFVGCLMTLLHLEKRREDSFYAVYLTAFWNLLLRVVPGILYSFAIVPFPIALPFAGKVGFVADACCVALLIYNHLGGVEDEALLQLYEEE